MVSPLNESQLLIAGGANAGFFGQTDLPDAYIFDTETMEGQ